MWSHLLSGSTDRLTCASWFLVYNKAKCSPVVYRLDKLRFEDGHFLLSHSPLALQSYSWATNRASLLMSSPHERVSILSTVTQTHSLHFFLSPEMGVSPRWRRTSPEGQPSSSHIPSREQWVYGMSWRVARFSPITGETVSGLASCSCKGSRETKRLTECLPPHCLLGIPGPPQSCPVQISRNCIFLGRFFKKKI